VRSIALLASGILAVVGAAGCGGSGSGGSSTAATTTAHLNKKFVVDPQNKSIVRFGKPASEAEREAASAVLEPNLKARQEADWTEQCATLSKFVVNQVKKEFKGKTCVASIESAAKPLAKSKPARVDTLGGPIDLLRVEGPRAYALYHGTDGKAYAIRMEREPGGDWKVGALVTTDISPTAAHPGP